MTKVVASRQFPKKSTNPLYNVYNYKGKCVLFWELSVASSSMKNRLISNSPSFEELKRIIQGNIDKCSIKLSKNKAFFKLLYRI